MKIRKTIIFFLIFFKIALSTLYAQMAGNPIGVRGKGEWTMSAMGMYTYQGLGGAKTISRRLFLKSNWGAANWFDIYFLGGGVQLELKTNKQGLTNYKSKYQFGYGIGFNLSLTPNYQSNPWILVGAQVLRFPSQGTFIEHFQVIDEKIERQFEMRYDWRELQGYTGIVIPYRFLHFYIAGIGWAVQRLDKKKEYLDYSNVKNLIGEIEGKYQSGLWTGGIFGIEFNLPQRYSIGIELLIFNEKNYYIMLGVCQTGSSEW